MAKKSPAAPQSLLDIAVSFGGVSIGENTARLGLKINRDVLSITAAEEALCGRRLTGLVQLGGNGDSAGQTKMFDSEITVSGTFDVNQFGVTPKKYTTGLTFNLSEIEVADLAQFSKGEGRLIVSNIGELETDEDDSEEGDEDE